MRAGTWGEEVQNALHGAQQPLQTVSHSSSGCLHKTRPANNQSCMERGPWALPLPDGLSPNGGFWRRNSHLFQLWTHCQTYCIPSLEHFQTHDTQMSLFKISESQKNTNRHQWGKWNYRVRGTDRRRKEGGVRETRMHCIICETAKKN